MLAGLAQQDDAYDAIVATAVRESTDLVPMTQSMQMQSRTAVVPWSTDLLPGPGMHTELGFVMTCESSIMIGRDL